MYIIRAIPGACGDIVTATIDDSGSMLTHQGSISFIKDRRLLKTETLSYDTLPALLEQTALKYKSISSQHYIEDIMITTKYQYITIDVDPIEAIDWCIDRLGKLYPNVQFNKESLIMELNYHNKFTNYKIKLSDILTGKLLDKLEQYNIYYNNSELYYKWLTINTKKYPYNF